MTSVAGEYALSKINDELNKIENFTSVLLPIKGNFFGENITVAGLITATDIIESLTPIKHEIKVLSIPSVMLKEGTNIFLDGKTTKDVEKALECEVFVTRDIYSTSELVNYIKNLNKF